MRPDRLLLQDMLEAIDEVLTETPAARDAFDADKLRRSHVLRYIQVIGETAWRLSDETKRRYPQVPWRQIASMRHAIVHHYFEIDWDAVFVAATRDVPPLRAQVCAILDALPPASP